MIRMTTTEKKRRRRIELPPPKKTKNRNKRQLRNDESKERNIVPPAERVAMKYGGYNVATAARMIGRTPQTVRRWLRYEESPKPSLIVPFSHYDMALFTDEDMVLLREWSEAQKPGRPKTGTSRKTVRRRPTEQFFREAEPENRYAGIKPTLMPRKPTPIEHWAKQQGFSVATRVQPSGGGNMVTTQYIDRSTAKKTISDPAMRLVTPNVPSTKRKKRAEKRH